MTNEQLVFARSFEKERKIVALNLSEKQEKIVFPYKRKMYEVIVQPHSCWIK